MVFLRLTIKVLPRERLSNGTSIERDKDAGAGVNGVPSGKTITFLVPVADPEHVTLGALAGLIQNKWSQLRPNAE